MSKMFFFFFVFFFSKRCPCGISGAANQIILVANNVDPDQTAPKEQSVLDLLCLQGASVQLFRVNTVMVYYKLLSHN